MENPLTFIHGHSSIISHISSNSSNNEYKEFELVYDKNTGVQFIFHTYIYLYDIYYACWVFM